MENIYESLPLGEKSPEIINVVIEIPKGSHNKYEFDEKTGRDEIGPRLLFAVLLSARLRLHPADAL